MTNPDTTSPAADATSSPAKPLKGLGMIAIGHAAALLVLSAIVVPKLLDGEHLPLYRGGSVGLHGLVAVLALVEAIAGVGLTRGGAWAGKAVSGAAFGMIVAALLYGTLAFLPANPDMNHRPYALTLAAVVVPVALVVGLRGKSAQKAE